MRAAAIGLDIQPSHTTVAEWDGTTPSTVRSVGDGIRRAVPHALDRSTWGSAAVAECVVPTEIRFPDDLMPWRVDPWALPSLRGLADRLGRYIGLPAATHQHGYHLWVVGDDAADRRAALEAAGLPDVTFVDPAAAVLAEWAAGGTRGTAADARFRGPVVVVACQEEATVVDAFHVDSAARPAVTRVARAHHRAPCGIGPVRLRVAAEVLRRRTRRERPVNVPALLAAVAEYGQLLTVGAVDPQGGARPTPTAVEWDGPLAEQLTAPLVLRQTDVDAFPETRTLVQELRSYVRRAAAAAGDEHAAVVLGGMGAGWGSLLAVADAARGTAISADPELSLAAGACFWSTARRLTRDVWSEPALPPSVAVPGATRLPARTGGVRQRPDRRLPDWLTTDTRAE